VVGSFEKLAYDVPANLVDEVVRIAESTMIERTNFEGHYKINRYVH
jgi:hypothetical protein